MQPLLNSHFALNCQSECTIFGRDCGIRKSVIEMKAHFKCTRNFSPGKNLPYFFLFVTLGILSTLKESRKPTHFLISNDRLRLVSCAMCSGCARTSIFLRLLITRKAFAWWKEPLNAITIRNVQHDSSNDYVILRRGIAQASQNITYHLQSIGISSEEWHEFSTFNAFSPFFLMFSNCSSVLQTFLIEEREKIQCNKNEWKPAKNW